MRTWVQAARSAASRGAAFATAGASALALYSTPQAECSAQPSRVQSGETARHKVVVIGGGPAGLSVAAQVMRKIGASEADVAIIEPSEFHYYRPGWTLAAGGITPVEKSRRTMGSVIPRGAKWIQAGAGSFDPDKRVVELDGGGRVQYDILVVATGMHLDLKPIKGLREALDDPKSGVVTIWSFDQARKVWDAVHDLRSGVAIFTQPRESRGCGGAPQKIMWLAEDWWRTKSLVRSQVEVEFVTGRDKLFPIQKYADALADIGAERGVQMTYNTELVEVDSKQRMATFLLPSGTRVRRHYDLLHVTPHMGPPPAVRDSKLAHPENGFVDVDQYTLEHVRYPCVFALGDCANLPTSKTAAAITAQAPVVVHNILCAMGKRGFAEEGIDKNSFAQFEPGRRGKALGYAQYDGYSSSPILTKRGGLILAEFKYGGSTKETFPFWFDQAKEVSVFYQLQTGFFPWAYWNLMLTGRWYGPRGVFEPRLKFIDTWLMP